MPTVWFTLLAFMIAMYVVLDGFDLGAGAIHVPIARNAAEREQVTAAIGPVWNGNEVWLIAGGGVLFLSFPTAYASAFSGLYFGLMIVLWLLIGRGLALELRERLESPLWHTACDTVFWLASAGLALVFGVALGNVVRGVPLQESGYFHMGLFDILNWYALLIGVFGLVVLAHHGAEMLSFRTTGPLAERARRWARPLYWAQAVLFVVMVVPTYFERHAMVNRLVDHPWRLIFPLLALVALAAIPVLHARAEWRRAFVASSLFIVGLLTTAAAGLYPDLLPARGTGAPSLTVHNAASSHYALSVALVWWSIGMLLAATYFVVAYRTFFRGPPAAGYGGD